MVLHELDLTYVASPHLAWRSLTEVANAAAQSPHPIRLLDCSTIQRAVRQRCSTHSRLQQHDGAEFCALRNPVQLHLPASVITQQSMPVELYSLILVWHEEHEWLQALTASLAVLCLQICRGMAPGTKCKVPVIMSGLIVQVPCYTGADRPSRYLASWT